MAALNYQTEDTANQVNTALFETNGQCGFVSKPNVMWDRSHVMYRRFNPWDKVKLLELLFLFSETARILYVVLYSNTKAETITHFLKCHRNAYQPEL